MEQFNDIKAFYKQLSKALTDIYTATKERSGPDEAMKTYEQRSALAQALKEKYPDYIIYAAYHALIGSTPLYKQTGDIPPVSKHDFPGDDSVERFIRKLKQDFNV